MNGLNGKSDPPYPWRKKKIKPKRCRCCRRCCVGLLHLFHKARATTVILMATLSVPGFYMTLHMLLSPGLATYTSRLHPSVCTVVSSTVLEGLTNCTWTSCRQGCTVTELFLCWQVLVVPDNLTASRTSPSRNRRSLSTFRQTHDMNDSKATHTTQLLMKDVESITISAIKLPSDITKSTTVSDKRPPSRQHFADDLENATPTQHKVQFTDTTQNITQFILEGDRKTHDSISFDYETEAAVSPSPSALYTPLANGSSSPDDYSNFEDVGEKPIPTISNVENVVQFVPRVSNKKVDNVKEKKESAKNMRQKAWDAKSHKGEVLRLAVNVVGCGYLSCADWWLKYGQLGSVYPCYLNADRTLAIPEVNYRTANTQIVFGVFPLLLIFVSFTIIYFSYCRRGTNRIFPLAPDKDVKKKKFEEAKMALLLQRAVEQNTKNNVKGISPLLVKEAMNKAKNQQKEKATKNMTNEVINLKRVKNPEVIISVAG